jgi:hypothetical protein
MYSCQRCLELIWDHLYDLLDRAESDELRAHLQDCADCQRELARAQVHERWLAQASRLDVEIPAFEAPGLAYPSLPRARGSVGWVGRLLPYAAVAAAVLFCLSLPAGLYWRDRAQQLARSVQVEARIDKLLQERDAILRDQPHAEEAVEKSTKSRFVRLELEGPLGYRPGRPSTYRVSATDLEGKPFPAVAFRVLDSAQMVLLEENRLAEKGQLQLVLPASLDLGPGHAGRLEVVAMGETTDGTLTIPLRLTPAAIAHLTIDRKAYSAGDRVYFSLHIRDRFALGDPDRIFQPVVTIRHGQDAPAAVLRTLSSRVGIAGGSWELPRTAAEGQYTITVNDPQWRFEPVSRTFLVGRAAPSPVESRLAIEAKTSMPSPTQHLPEIKINKHVFGTGEGIEVKLTGCPPGRRLVLRLLCRGIVAGQEALTTTSADRAVTLHPAADAAGLMHLLVLDDTEGRGEPLADRSVYLKPEKALRVTAKLDHSRYRAGDKVSIRLQTENERGLAEASWLQVSVVEMGASGIDSAPSLPADCYFASELGGSQPLTGDIDSLLAQTLQATASLEKFLRDQDRDGPVPGAGAPEKPPLEAIIRLDNSAPIERKSREALATALAGVRAQTQAKAESLAAEAKNALEEVRQGWQGLERPRLLSLGILTGALILSATGFFMAMVNRKGKLAAPHRAYLAFGSGLAALFAITAIINISGSPSLDPGGTDLLARLETPSQLPALAARETELPGKIPFIGVIQATPSKIVSLPPPQNTSRPSGPTLIWAPAIFAEKGWARLTFSLPAIPGSYRVSVEGHSASGRMGACQTTIRSE